MHQVHPDSPLEESPLALLYDRYAPLLLSYLSRYVPSKEDADDLLLDVFLVALEQQVWLSWNEGEQLAWLRRIAYHKAIDLYRRRSRYPSVDLEHFVTTLFSDAEQSPDQVLLRHESYADLHAHLSTLSELQQTVLLLRFGHGLRTKEIAQRLKKSDDVIRVILSRTLNLLRTLYRQQEGG